MDSIAGTVSHDSEMPFPKPTALLPDERVKRSTRHRRVAYMGIPRARTPPSPTRYFIFR